MNHIMAAKTNGETNGHVNGGSVQTDFYYGLASSWPEALDLAGSNVPCRLEGEIGDLIVRGKIPKEIDGTFYRVMCDPFVPPDPNNVPIDGDGNVSAPNLPVWVTLDSPLTLEQC